MNIAEEEHGEPRGYEKVPAVVFAHLLPGELRIILAPDHGMGGAPRDIALELVPPALRLPNTRIWVRLDHQMSVVRVWRRTAPTGYEPG
jgi:hypothetical protein